MLGHWRCHPRKLQQCSKNNGAQRPSKLRKGGSCACSRIPRSPASANARSHGRAQGLAQYTDQRVCRFLRAPGGTGGTVKQLDCDLIQLSSSSSSAGSSPRLDAAAAARPGVVVKPTHGALVGFSISDDAQQNAGHLLAQRCAAREMQLRCRGLRQYKTYANKSDGAGVYSSIQQCGSPGQARGGTPAPGSRGARAPRTMWPATARPPVTATRVPC
jgi:hypothetical protein